MRMLRPRPDGLVRRKVRRIRDLSCGDRRIYLELEVRRIDCRNCGKVKREQLDFLADNPFYTKRFAYFVGRRCRQSSISDVAKELALDWHTVKALEMQYMEAQLARAGTPGPLVIGIDEIAIRKGHTYRIVDSNLLRGRPIWFGGKDRSEASMVQFYAWLGTRKSARIRLYPYYGRTTRFRFKNDPVKSLRVQQIIWHQIQFWPLQQVGAVDRWLIGGWRYHPIIAIEIGSARMRDLDDVS